MVRVLLSVSEESGINFNIRPPKFKTRGAPLSIEGRVYYAGPIGHPSPGSIKLDLLGSEKVVRPTALREVAHPFPDEFPTPAQIRCYSLEELFAEKIRALGERCRPRDLYDVINLYRREDLGQDPELVHSILKEKCASKNLPVPTLAALEASLFRAELHSEWGNMLGHQLQHLPPIEPFWADLAELFSWLEVKRVPRALTAVGVGPDDDLSWSPPPTSWNWGMGVPIEAIRFAASNRLCVELGYQGTKRIIEPYSLRRTKAGDLLLYAVRASNRELRCYRIDRMESVQVTDTPYKPVFTVEFSARGPIIAEPARTSQLSSYSHGRSKPRRPTIAYVLECPFCHRRFTRRTRTHALNPHKDGSGRDCHGRKGFVVETRWEQVP
jgi:predicted nucleotidyltransferase component of viral defense system